MHFTKTREIPSNMYKSKVFVDDAVPHASSFIPWQTYSIKHHLDFFGWEALSHTAINEQRLYIHYCICTVSSTTLPGVR